MSLGASLRQYTGAEILSFAAGYIPVSFQLRLSSATGIYVFSSLHFPSPSRFQSPTTSLSPYNEQQGKRTEQFPARCLLVMKSPIDFAQPEIGFLNARSKERRRCIAAV